MILFFQNILNILICHRTVYLCIRLGRFALYIIIKLVSTFALRISVGYKTDELVSNSFVFTSLPTFHGCLSCFHVILPFRFLSFFSNFFFGVFAFGLTTLLLFRGLQYLWT